MLVFSNHKDKVGSQKVQRRIKSDFKKRLIMFSRNQKKEPHVISYQKKKLRICKVKSWAKVIMLQISNKSQRKCFVHSITIKATNPTSNRTTIIEYRKTEKSKSQQKHSKREKPEKFKSKSRASTESSSQQLATGTIKLI